MELWLRWMSLVRFLKGACNREKTFFWLITALIGFTIKFDTSGVTSLARGVGLCGCYYTNLLHLFSSSSLNLIKLQHLWIRLIKSQFTGLLVVNGRHVIVGDGIKYGKEGKKMPAVKSLHQDSQSNSKASKIMGHSLQVVALLGKGLHGYFAMPLTGRIHEGIRLHYTENKTLLDKMFDLLVNLDFGDPFYFVADKYYCSGRFMKQLIKSGSNLITMMKTVSVAYRQPEPEPKRRGRPKKYGEKVKLFDLFNSDLEFTSCPMPGNPKVIIEYYVIQLLWRPVGRLVNFVLVKHPTRGNSICMSTDLLLKATDIIFIYALRFKIEVAFKEAIYQIGTFMYHFWLKCMNPTKKGDGNIFLQFSGRDYKEKILNKMRTYHVFIQIAFIAHGLMQWLSVCCYKAIWDNFGSWMRTIRANVMPSAKVVCMAMRNTYAEFLLDDTTMNNVKKFIIDRTDFNQLKCNSPPLKKAA